MKTKRILSPFYITLLYLVLSSGIHAQPFIGGELFWEPTQQGNLKLTLVHYRECYCVDLPQSITIQSNVPGFTVFQLTKESIVELSPVCGCPGGTSIQCASVNALYTGAVEAHIYTSDYEYPQGIPITGIPPANGWYFSHNSCCRPPSTNLQSQVTNFAYKVIMYPYQNTPVDSCFDSSPKFYEYPKSVSCTGYNTVLNHSAYDPDPEDSLVYEWTPLTMSDGTPVPSSLYYSYYNYNMPFPGPAHNSSNTITTLDNTTGLISFNVVTSGTFCYSLKVTSYKHGIKVSETFREFFTVLTPCDTANHPPVFSNSIASSQSPQGISFVDTAIAGETVSFNISATDWHLCPDTSSQTPQTVELSAYSSQFGIPLNVNGCAFSPCATLSPSPDPTNPLSGSFFQTTNFLWQTSCNHLKNNHDNSYSSKKYHFLFKAKDNYCPVPLTSYNVVTIVVKNLPSVMPPDSLQTAVLPSGDVLLTWKQVTDTMNSFTGYYIWTADSLTGSFTLVDSLMNISDTFFIHTGADADIKTTCYYISVKSGCNNTFERSSDTTCCTSTNIRTNDRDCFFFTVGQNIPNPVSETTTIPFTLPKAGIVSFTVSDITGTILIKTIYQAVKGNNHIKIGLDKLNPGLYYYTVEYQGTKQSKKMIVFR